MKAHRFAFFAASALGCTLIVSGVATAAVASSPAHTRTTSKPPAGYVVVSSAATPAPAFAQTSATVTCPGSTRPVGGGVKSDSGDLGVTVNASYPSGKNTWTGTLNNGSGAATDVTVYAVCIKRPAAQFTESRSGFTVPRNGENSNDAVCPSGVVVGGGVRLFATSPTVKIASIGPSSSTSWGVRMTHPGGSPYKARVYAICEKVQPAGYSIQTSAPSDNPPGNNMSSAVGCPGASVPLSGGVESSSTDLNVDVNLFAPVSVNNTWFAHVVNASADDNTISTVAVCAGT